MELLTVVIPYHNSESHMEHCINTLSTGGEEVEIIIMDSGSVENRTGKIADRYAREYPTVCRAIHQEDGRHGGAVNTRFRSVTGTFFKVVDSDDWVSEEVYEQVPATLKRSICGGGTLDILATSFIYRKGGAGRKKVMKYYTAFPEDKVFGWNDARFFITRQYILIHSVTYRIGLSIRCDLEFPRHVFYVDNILMYQPLPHVKYIYYPDVDFYHYYIGRQDQSVNREAIIGHIDQQVRVTKLVLGCYDVMKMSNRRLHHCIIQYLEIVMTIRSVLTIRSGTEGGLGKKKGL